MKKIKLGQKVKCHSFVRKTGNWIEQCSYYNDVFLRLHNKKTNLCEPLEFDEFVEINEIIKKEFEGFVCGKKKIYTHISCAWYDGIDTGFGTPPDTTRIEKDNYIECYEVCVENKNKSWGKRYVPTKDIEVEKNEKN